METVQVKLVTCPDLHNGFFGFGQFWALLPALLCHIHDFGCRNLELKNQLGCKFELAYMQNIHIIYFLIFENKTIKIIVIKTNLSHKFGIPYPITS